MTAKRYHEIFLRSTSLLLLFFWAGCSAPSGENRLLAVRLPSGTTLKAEIAITPESRSRGLMFRERLDPDRAMLFFFPTAGQHPFWMKNTLIPLDMIWLDREKRIIHIEPNVPPCQTDPCPNYGPPQDSAMFVLETAAGVAEQEKLTIGIQLSF